MTRIAIVAGEPSGDRIGAGLIKALRAWVPDASFEGVAGPRMIEAGCKTLYPMERLAVMGITEVIRRYRELRTLRDHLACRFAQDAPEVFVGVDAPDFNLGLAHRLHQKGIRTVQYVSPQVWAWREGRVKRIAQAVDLMLTLFPFEEGFYRRYDIVAKFVGHPLADEIPLQVDRTQARCALGLSEQGPIIALLPGSRSNEWHHHTEPFICAAAWCYQREPSLRFIVPSVSRAARGFVERSRDRLAPDLPLAVFDGRSQTGIAASDVVLTVSGTATLETMLLGKPMVVAYRMGWLSYFVARLLVKAPFIALPNILAERCLVPELIQGDVRTWKLGQELLCWLKDRDRAAALQGEFKRLHTLLRQSADKRAAQAIAEMMRAGEAVRRDV
ncbi:MAG: lipid-A-disaccharide synthase [Gammaproteobacteria bacterium]